MRAALATIVPLALALGGCGTVQTDSMVKLMTTFSTQYAHCHHGVTYSAVLGGMNPGSGVTVQGQIDCPAVPATPTPVPPA